MRKTTTALFACAMLALSLPQARAITLQQLLVPGTEVTVGCIKFSNFRNFSVLSFGSALISSGFASDGSDLNLVFTEPSPGYIEVIFSPFDITMLGTGIVQRTVMFEFDAQAIMGAEIFAVDASGIFGATVAPNTANPPTNVANALFVNTYIPNAGIGPVNLALAGTKDNVPPFGNFISMTDVIAPIGPAGFVSVQAFYDLNLIINDGFASSLYNAHVSAYKQSWHYTPEPGALALLGAFGAVTGLALLRRRRA